MCGLGLQVIEGFEESLCITLCLSGMYFACSMFLVSLSLVMTVFVLNMHFRTPEERKVPPWMKKVFLRFGRRFLLRQSENKIQPSRVRKTSNVRLQVDFKKIFVQISFTDLLYFAQLKSSWTAFCFRILGSIPTIKIEIKQRYSTCQPWTCKKLHKVPTSHWMSPMK